MVELKSKFAKKSDTKFESIESFIEGHFRSLCFILPAESLKYKEKIMLN